MKISTIKTGDIVLVDLDPTRGAEKKKTRPCIVVEAQASALGLFLAVPITDDKHQKSPLFVKIKRWKEYGLTKPSVIDVYQVRSLDSSRILNILGKVSDEILNEIRKIFAILFAIEEQHLNAI
jgi:mRNA interferase MazF